MSREKRRFGLCWHFHHDVLIEWCFDYEKRVAIILANKSKQEHELRLRSFQFVKGKLPEEVVRASRALDKAWLAFKKASQACDKAWRACDKASLGDKDYDKAWQVSDKAWQVSDEALQACNEASRDCKRVFEKYQTEIEDLHRQECPNCPWDGKTIFPK